jgi:hypothetical protein
MKKETVSNSEAVSLIERLTDATARVERSGGSDDVALSEYVEARYAVYFALVGESPR